MDEFDRLYEMFSGMTLEEAKKWLRQYVELDQPETGEFGNASLTSRALCRCASMALEKTPPDNLPSSYTDTRYGIELYWHMWGLE